MLNKVILMGRLTKSPDTRTTQNGKFVSSFTLAVDRDFDRDKVDFIPCVTWGKTAEFVDKWFQKGQLVAVTGELQSRQYTDRDGNKRTVYEVTCQTVHFAESKRNESKAPDVAYEATDDEEVPF